MSIEKSVATCAEARRFLAQIEVLQAPLPHPEQATRHLPDWIAAMALALNGCTLDAADLTSWDQEALHKVATQLDAVAVRDGMAAADRLHQQIVDMLMADRG